MIIMDLALVSCKFTFPKLHFLTLVVSKLNYLPFMAKCGLMVLCLNLSPYFHDKLTP